MYAVANARTACGAALAAPPARSRRGGGGDGYSWVRLRPGERRPVAAGCGRSARGCRSRRAAAAARAPPHAASAPAASRRSRSQPHRVPRDEPGRAADSGCQPIPALPSPGPAASCVSQRSPATYMNTWSALAYSVTQRPGPGRPKDSSVPDARVVGRPGAGRRRRAGARRCSSSRRRAPSSDSGRPWPPPTRYGLPAIWLPAAMISLTAGGASAGAAARPFGSSCARPAGGQRRRPRPRPARTRAGSCAAGGAPRRAPARRRALPEERRRRPRPAGARSAPGPTTGRPRRGSRAARRAPTTGRSRAGRPSTGPPPRPKSRL